MTIYINIVTGQYPVYEGEIKRKYSNTSFATPFIAPEDYATVIDVGAPIVDHTKNVTEGTPALQDGKWVQVWNITDATDEEIEQRTEQKAASVRAERNAKLAASDWTQGKDIPDNVSSAWATYRQALRDVPSQTGFPWSVQWPTQPE
jgi:hypothetical protein